MVRKLIRILFACAFVACFIQRISATGYTGNELLLVLGMQTASPEFKDFRNAWQLDKNYENSSHGIKLYVGEADEKVESIVIAGDSLEIGGAEFSKCSLPLPFGITMKDNVEALKKKLGQSEKLIGRSALKFYYANVIIEASFKFLPDGKISYLKFNSGVKPATSAAVLKKEKPAIIEKDKPEAKRRRPEKTTLTAPETKPVGKKPEEMSSFKRTILDVFNSSHESALSSIKNGFRTERNFWNYKYTYNTNLKLQGEKYNMLYSFPFITSGLDFVVVIKESNYYDKSFEKDYHKFEKLLLDNFPASEGWISYCLPNPGKSKLADIEVRNDNYGAVILDYTKSPRGGHILYLRFLLFS